MISAKCCRRGQAVCLFEYRDGVLAADERLEVDAEREVGREGVVHDGVDPRDYAA